MKRKNQKFLKLIDAHRGGTKKNLSRTFKKTTKRGVSSFEFVLRHHKIFPLDFQPM
jgi:hypothetical protein